MESLPYACNSWSLTPTSICHDLLPLIFRLKTSPSQGLNLSACRLTKISSTSKSRQPTSRTNLLKHPNPPSNNLLSLTNRQASLPLGLHQRIPQTPQRQHIIRTSLPFSNHTPIFRLHPRFNQHKPITVLVSCWRAAAHDIEMFAWVRVVEESA